MTTNLESMKKVINVDAMTIIERFDEKDAQKILTKYENDPRFKDVSIDRDGDIGVWDDDLAEWLTQNKDVLSFNWIEAKYNIPQGTLSKVVKGTRPLPKRWIEPLTALKKQLCGGEK